MKKLRFYALLATMTLCSACANKSNFADAGSAQQASANWEDTFSVTNIVRPSNSFLIGMR